MFLFFFLGKTGFITCKVKGLPPPSVTWYKDSGTVDISGKRYSLDKNGLRIQNLKSPDDDGTYTLLASTERQTLQQDITVMVSTVPEITKGFNKDMTLAHRKKKTFTCAAKSRPESKFKFYRYLLRIS